MRKTVKTVLIVLLLASSSLFASGFQINEHGARGMGMGGAFTGLANDPSAVYFNPAGITQLEGTYFSIGGTILKPMTKFTGPNPSTQSYKLNERYFVTGTFYFTQSLGNNFYVGLAFNSPFGLGTDWKNDWVGRYKSLKTIIETYNLQPVVAYKVSDKLSVAAGLTVSFANVLITKNVKMGPLPDSHLELYGDDVSLGYSLAAFYKPIKDLSFGISYRSGVDYDFKGDAIATYDPVTPAAFRRLPTGSITAPFDAPQVFSLGAAYHVNDKWVLTSDFQYTGWSSYKELAVTFDNLPLAAGSNPSSSIRDFNNSYIVRVGSEYQESEKIAMRCGLFFDKNPVDDERLDPTLPDADRIGITGGLGFKLTEKLSADISYMYLAFLNREITNSKETMPINSQAVAINGKYESFVHILAFGFNYNL